MSFRNFKGGKFTRKAKYKDIVNDLGDDRGTNEFRQSDKKLNDGLNILAKKDMYKGSYAIKVDPYREMNQATQVYDFITRMNKVISPSYQGDFNLDGGYVSQYLSSKDTKLLDVADAMLAKLKLNYRFLSYREDTENVSNAPTRFDDAIYESTGDIDKATVKVRRGEMLLRSAYDAINEAVSQLDATTFMTLHLCNNYAVATSLQIPNVPYAKRYHGAAYNPDDEGSNPDWVYIYNDVPAIILITALQYQTTLLNIITAFNIQNKIKFYEKVMLNMQYDRETSNLNRFYSQIMKQTFSTNLESIVLALKGEYIDADFIKTMNMILNVVSRDSNAMINPIKELVGCLDEPRYFALFSNVLPNSRWDDFDEFDKFEIALGDYYIARSVVWLTGPDPIMEIGASGNARTVRCSDCMTYQVNEYDEEAEQVKTVTKLIKMGNNILGIAQDYSLTGQLLWARATNLHTISNAKNLDGYIDADDVNVTSAKGYYNNLEDFYYQIAMISNKIKTSFPDFRTVLDKMTPLGLVTWTKGVQLDINTNTFDTETVNFKIVSDIYKTILSGPRASKFSSDTGRWTAQTFWDLYDGIPQYDAISGGCFITFSGRDLDCNNDVESDLGYLPQLYNFDSDTLGDINIYLVTRSGNLVVLDITVTTVENDLTLNRLAMLPIQNDVEIKLPTFDHIIYANPASEHPVAVRSWLRRIMTEECGFFKDGDQIHLSPTIVALYPFEVLNASKSTQAYAKATAVFRGTTDSVPNLGFAGLTVNRK